jgi:hypothetical protein
MSSKEKNAFMDALNSLKQAVSGIEKEYTMMQGTRTGEQDGNIGNAKNGVEGYSDDFENISKKKMLIKSMMES